MWSDNETDRDLLNFQHIADITSQRIFGAKGHPLSIGISGGWGMGKSSMLQLLKKAIQDEDAKRQAAYNVTATIDGTARRPTEVRFIEFNAWLYQSHDDARSALMEAITQSLLDHAKDETKGFGSDIVESAKSLAKRVSWFRWAKVGAGVALSHYTGSEMPAMFAAMMSAGESVKDGNLSADDVKKLEAAYSSISKEGKDLFKSKVESTSPASPSKAIDAFRNDLQSTLNRMSTLLIVLIDDLDRCLPETAIATLEAMRLFLFMKNTAFIIAADDEMIRESVRVHFKGAILKEEMVRSYFDKLIQLPVRVPPLGTQDVRAYLMMLFVDESDLSSEHKDKVREAVCGRLANTWNGSNFDREFMLDTIKEKSGNECSLELSRRITMADRVAPILASSSEVRGNPRLIKRFLNTLLLRSSLAEIQGINVNEEVLVKLLIFERCGSETSYKALLSTVNESADGRSQVLKDMEDAVRIHKQTSFNAPYDQPFIREWLLLDPPLGGEDLRAAAYVSRDNMAIIGRPDELSPQAVDILEAMLIMRGTSSPLVERAKGLDYKDALGMMDRILAKAGHETEWGTPEILDAALAMSLVDERHARSLYSFLAAVPPQQLQPAIVPRLAAFVFAKDLFREWILKDGLESPMKKAIEQGLR